MFIMESDELTNTTLTGLRAKFIDRLMKHNWTSNFIHSISDIIFKDVYSAAPYHLTDEDGSPMQLIGHHLYSNVCYDTNTDKWYWFADYDWTETDVGKIHANCLE